MNIGFHHLMYKYKYIDRDVVIKSSKFREIINKGVYISGVVGVLVILPQAATIWLDKTTSGVSMITWVGFLFGSLFWFFYGIIHGEKPIILTNAMVILADLTVIIGLLVIK